MENIKKIITKKAAKVDGGGFSAAWIDENTTLEYEVVEGSVRIRVLSGYSWETTVDGNPEEIVKQIEELA